MLQNLSSWPLTDCTKSWVPNPTIPSRGKRDSAFKVAVKSRKSPLNQFRRSIFINRAYRPGCKLKSDPEKEGERVWFSPSPPQRGENVIKSNEGFLIQTFFQPTHSHTSEKLDILDIKIRQSFYIFRQQVL